MSAPKVKGFKPKRTLYRLDFDGTDLEGLEVDARGSSLEEVLTLMENADELGDLKELDENADAKEIAAKMRELVAPFGRKLVHWNLLTDDDEPVPASVDGLLTQELGFVIRLITAYSAAMQQAPPPLPGGSASGGTSQAELTAMASLSRSPGS